MARSHLLSLIALLYFWGTEQVSYIEFVEEEIVGKPIYQIKINIYDST